MEDEKQGGGMKTGVEGGRGGETSFSEQISWYRNGKV
jgi:hypothetical protein